MFSYTVTFSHSEIDEKDLRAFLEYEFSLWDLTVTRSEAASAEVPRPFRVTFQHPWIEPATIFEFLEREYQPEDLSVSRDGQAALSFTGSRSDEEGPVKRGRARKTEALRMAVLQLFEEPGVVTADRLATVTGTRAPSAVQNVLKGLIADGKIRRLGPGRFLAADQPDPEPEPKPVRARTSGKPSVRARRSTPETPLEIRPDTPADLDAAILRQLEEGPGGTLASLQAVANGRAQPTIHQALQRLMEQGRIRRSARGIYVAEGRPDPSPAEVALLRSRRAQGDAPGKAPAKTPAVTAPKVRKTRAHKGKAAGDASEADLLAFLSEPRGLAEIRARFDLSRAAALGRLEQMEAGGQIHRRRAGLRHLYASDPARLEAMSRGGAEDLRPAEWTVLQKMPLEGRLRLPPLAKAAGMNAGQTLAAARRMQERGLLALRQDGRAWLLSLTEAGIEAADLEEGRGKGPRLEPEEDLFTVADKGDLDAA